MKNLYFVIIIFLFTAISLYAQCGDQTQFSNVEKIASKTLRLDRTSEIELKIKASSNQSSWAKQDAESAALTVLVDEKYHQDILLFAGEQLFDYKVFIGALSKGNHLIEIVWNKQLSAKQSAKPTLKSIETNLLRSNSMLDKFALQNAPFIYARPDTVGRFSDIPLVVYYEIIPEGEKFQKIRYSVIFSHEDGGTNSQGLMARWGRMTDIEWLYEITLDEKMQKVSTVFQAANHETKNFQGKTAFGSHPLFFDATFNNNFADSGCSQIRFAPAPVKADLKNASRETLMEKFPWIYRIMAEEIMREKRVDSENLSANKIGDPRDYLYFEIYQEPENSAVSVSVETENEKFSSDWNKEFLRVGRQGFVRIALFIPRKIARREIKNITLYCHPLKKNESGVCKNMSLKKIVRLDENLMPIETLIDKNNFLLNDGQSSKIAVDIK